MAFFNRKNLIVSVGVLSLFACAMVAPALAETFSLWSVIKPTIALVPQAAGTVVDNQGKTNTIKIVDFGQTVYTGPVSVKSTLDRIRVNNKLPHNNDGSIFSNSSRLLPVKPAGYYIEFVHWPYGVNERPLGMTFPGPMRVILGKGGETYFTGDHYSSFYKIK